MGEILTIMVAAVLTENLVLTRFMGICPFMGVSERPSTAFGMGAAVTCVMTLSSAAAWAAHHFILAPFGLEYLRTVVFVLIIATLVGVMEMIMKKHFNALYKALGIFLPLVTTNCAVLGAALIAADNEYSFVNSVIYGAFSAIGFTLAILIFAGVRERVRFADPPAAFEGMPVALVAAGLLAMAFAGFYGIEIKL